MKQICRLRIEKLTYQGYGLGFKDSIPVFVLNAVPGDLLDVQVMQQRGKVLFGAIERIIEPSENRIEPHCEAFGKCGGCDWLNLEYHRQLEVKDQLLKEIFRNITIRETRQIIASPRQFHYRNKSFFPISTYGGEPVIGMFARKSHKVIAHGRCRLHPPLYDEIIAAVTAYLKASHTEVYDEVTGKGTARHLGLRFSETNNELIVVVVTKSRKLPFSNQLTGILIRKYPQIVGIVQNINPHKTNVILGREDKILFGRDHIFEQIGPKRFKLNYQSFFQINSEIAEKMYEFVKSAAKDSRHVLDAYCGVGSIGIYAADGAKSVLGIESNERAVADARANALLNNQQNCRFLTGKVEDVLPRLTESFDTVIFDPPRQGLDATTIAAIPSSTTKIIYISCDPATQQRDVVKLAGMGFEAVLMQPFDMFPNTFHIENVIVLER